MLDRPYRPEQPVLRARDTLLVAPSGEDGPSAARRLQEGIGAAVGERLTIVPAADLDEAAWTSHDLVVLGNLNTSAAARRLYTRSHTFADGLFPGGAGVHVHTVADPFGSGRGCFVLGASTPRGTARAIDAFCRAIGERGPAPGRLSLLASGDVDVPPPAAGDLARVREDCHRRFLAGSGVLAVHRAIEAGLLFQLTGAPAWAEHFRAILFDYMALAAEHGTYAFEHMLFVYSWIWKLVAVWDLIEDAPVFDDADRLAFGNCLLALGRYTATLPYWTQPDVLGAEPRQNHQTFAALSLDAVATYLRKAYAVAELDPLLPAARQIMEGQLTSYKPNDDAGGTYVWLVPRHVLRYSLRHGDERFVQDGRLRDLAELAILTTDNRRDECTYGDLLEYRPAGESRPLSLQILSAAAYFYRDGRYAWAYDWLSQGMRFADSRTLEQPASWSEFYDGQYAAGITPEYPEALTGVRAMHLDAGALAWVDRRAEALGWTRDPSRTYFDKIAFRRDFDPGSEYLCLEGPSTYAHGHRDGNSITRLTWRDRIWLADLDYIRHHARYHSSVVVVRDGCDEGPPPLTELDRLADLPGLGETTTTVRDYNGATWRRQILWAKGDFFLVLDEIEAQQPGEYFTECLWRLLGDVSIQDRRAVVTQAGESLVVANGDGADGASLSLHEEEPRLSSWSHYPHARGGVRVLRQRQRASMRAGDRRRAVNLLAAGGAERGYGVRTVRDGLYAVERDGSDHAIVLHPRRGAVAGVGVNADLLLVRDGSLAALRCTELSTAGAGGGTVRLFSSSAPVDVEVSLHGGEMVVRSSAPVTVELDAGGAVTAHPVGAGKSEPIPLGAAEDWVRLAAVVTAGAAGASPAAPDVAAPPPAPRSAPDAASLPARPPAVTRLWRAPAPITALAVPAAPAGALGGGGDPAPVRVVAGTAGGEVIALAAGGEVVWRAGLEGPILSLLSEDVDGDGAPECVAGTGAAELALLDARGARRWRTVFDPAHNRSQHVTGLAVADLDGRGRRSILAATEGWLLHAFDAGGRSIWQSWINHHAATFCAAADVDGDGLPEIVVGNEYHTPINLFGPDGVMRWSSRSSAAGTPSASSGVHATALTLCDVDADGRPEIVYGTLDNLVCAAGAGGSLLWSTNVGGQVVGLAHAGAAGPPGVPARAPAIYAVSAYGDLTCLDTSGRRTWRCYVGDEATSLVVGRDAGGSAIAVVGTAGGWLHLYGAAGERLASVALGDAPVSCLVPADDTASVVLAACGTALTTIALATWRSDRGELPESAVSPTIPG